MIRLYLKIPENYVHLILQDGFWFVLIPFDSKVKFQFLAQFPVDYFFHPVLSSLLLFCTNLQHLLILWLIIIIIIIKFSVLFSVSYKSFIRSLPKTLAEGSLWLYVFNVYVFVASFGSNFSIHIDSIFLRRWAVMQSAIIYYWLGLPGILLMCLSISFLIITRFPTITMVVLRWHIFSLSIFKSLYFLIFLYFLTDTLALPYQLEGMFFFSSP